MHIPHTHICLMCEITLMTQDQGKWVPPPLRCPHVPCNLFLPAAVLASTGTIGLSHTYTVECNTRNSPSPLLSAIMTTLLKSLPRKTSTRTKTANTNLGRSDATVCSEFLTKTFIINVIINVLDVQVNALISAAASLLQRTWHATRLRVHTSSVHGQHTRSCHFLGFYHSFR